MAAAAGGRRRTARTTSELVFQVGSWQPLSIWSKDRQLYHACRRLLKERSGGTAGGEEAHTAPQNDSFLQTGGRRRGASRVARAVAAWGRQSCRAFLSCFPMWKTPTRAEPLNWVQTMPVLGKRGGPRSIPPTRAFRSQKHRTRNRNRNQVMDSGFRSTTLIAP